MLEEGWRDGGKHDGGMELGRHNREVVEEGIHENWKKNKIK